MKDKFDKTRLLSAARRILVDLAFWADDIYGAGASERLIGMTPATKHAESLDSSGSAGIIIERSVVLSHVGRIVDYLNTNVWHGDPSNLWATLKELTALYGLLESPFAIINESENAIDGDSAAAIFEVLEEFFARVNFEFEDEALELKELALVAGLAEKTVRMAAVGQDKNPDLTTFKIGSRTYVTPEEAKRWLATKKTDYRPIQYSEDQFLPPVDPKDLGELGGFLRDLREKSYATIDELANRLAWDDSTRIAYELIENSADDIDVSALQFDQMLQLSQAICPGESAELVRIIDSILHPIALEKRIAEQLPSSTGQ
jgi:hypothetical protein